MEERGAITSARLIGDQVRRLLRTTAMARAVVVGKTAQGLVLVRWPESDVADDQAYARLTGFDVAVGDEVLVLPLAGVPVVLGKLQRSAPGTYTLDQQLTCPEIKDASLINTSGVRTRVSAQNAADTTSTTDTVNWSTALTRDFTVPGGTWFVRAAGFLNVRNDGAHTSQVRVEVDGTVGSTFSRTAGALSSPHFVPFVAYAEKSGVTATTINVKVQFRSGSGGTTTAANPAIWVDLYRTA